MKLSDLKTKYANFINPTISVTVDGKKLGDQYMIHELEATLTIERDEVSAASFKVTNTQNFVQEPSKYMLLVGFGLMKEIEISTGYDQENTAVFKGIIFERSWTYSGETEPVLTVYCLDHKALLRENITYASHKEMTSFSDLVSAVVKKYGFSKSVDSTDKFAKPITMSQYGISDFDYIEGIAAETGYEFFVQDKKLYFRKPRSVSGVLISFEPQEVQQITHRSSMAGLCSELRLQGYNQDKRESKSASVTTIKEKVGSGNTACDILKKNNQTLVRCRSIQMTNRTDRDLAKTAAVLMDSRSMRMTELTVDTWGIPEVVPGRLIEIKGIGDEVSGQYYATKVKHTLQRSGYQTQLTCCANTVKT